MKFVVEQRFADSPAIPFIHSLVTKFDVSKLHEFKIRTGTGQRSTVGIHGNCKYPNRSATSGARSKYRISCSIKGKDADYPKNGRPMMHAGTIRPEYIYESVAEMLVWVSAHEMYHYLSATKQIKGDPKSERNADKMANACVTLYKEGMTV